MADIQITDLKAAGSELFEDQDGVMTELTERELSVAGGSISHGGGYGYSGCGCRPIFIFIGGSGSSKSSKSSKSKSSRSSKSSKSSSSKSSKSSS